MAEQTFSELGRIEAISRLFEGTGYSQCGHCTLHTGKNTGSVVHSSVLMTEGIDFDLTYFPLKHLGYKAVIEATGEIYAALAHPRTLAVRLAVSSKTDFDRVRELWDGVVTAAKEHGYEELSLDLMPSVNGLVIGMASSGDK